MDAPTPFCGPPADAREAILQATWVALAEHGYAGLSIGRIADAADRSKSTVYHHFDDKDELLGAFVDFIIAEFLDLFSAESGPDPEENLQTFLDLLLTDEEPDETEIHAPRVPVLRVYVELRAQAVRDESVRRKFTDADGAIVDQLATILENGVEAGVFEPVDPDAVATYLMTVVAGTVFLETTRTDHDTAAVRAELDQYLEERLLADAPDA